MQIPYELWPIWADYLEEQGFETELLRYILTYPYHIYTSVSFRDNNGAGNCWYGSFRGKKAWGATYYFPYIIDIPKEYGININLSEGCGFFGNISLRGDGYDFHY